jgi:2-polyprenyl-3-methyl-5-hydroxy-6-metoxy-1,4-benzoquinol methylase
MRSSQSNRNNNFTSSFRDPSGHLLIVDDRIIRIVTSAGIPDLQAFLDSATSQKFLKSGQLVETDELDLNSIWNILDQNENNTIPDGSIVLEHEHLPFQNFPYEWPAEMLHAAGELTLELAESLLSEGLGLKDATPYNIIFRGPTPVFVDLLSFERRDARNPIWLPEAQFERTFLLPLLVNKHFGINLDQLLSVRRDGIEPEEVYRLCGNFKRLLPPFLSLVSIPAWLGARNSDDAKIYQPKRLDNAEKAAFILRSLYRRLRRILDDLEPKSDKVSKWTNYTTTDNNYSEGAATAKVKFVERAIAEFKPKKLLDIGCNTGRYSELAASTGASVVAIDSDPAVVGVTWRKARSEQLDILPLVVNLTRPSPAIGWRNAECPAFLDRARGKFDAVLMLAVIHHMLVSERVPLAEIIDLASELTSDLLIIEFVEPSDSMFRRLTRGREQLFSDLTLQLFEQTCNGRFEIIRSERLEDADRWLYLLRKRRQS